LDKEQMSVRRQPLWVAELGFYETAITAGHWWRLNGKNKFRIGCKIMKNDTSFASHKGTENEIQHVSAQ
jgi:hypothetical protein